MYRSSLQYQQAEHGLRSRVLPLRETYHNTVNDGGTGSKKTIFQSALQNCKTANGGASPSSQNGAVRDLQIAELFSAMRQASRLDTNSLAMRLETTPEIIIALETGDLSRLPEWDDVARVVSVYAQLINIEDKPILRRLRECLTTHFLNQLSRENNNGNDFTKGQFNSGHSSPLNKNLVTKTRHSDVSPFPSTDVNLQALAEGRKPISTPSAKLNTNAAFQPLSNGPSSTFKDMHGTLEQTIGELNSFAQNLDGVKPNTFAHEVKPPQRRFSAFTKFFFITALVISLLIGFINWQPNRFWSGVDQLPKPISNSIYTIFEYLMPDPMASSYRMNWVFVEDPRLRKADKLKVPKVKKLPPIDFSNLGRGLIK